ncbi:putative membrane protein [Sphingobacterium zeae]|uniref:Membrane protein n=1 Tax=Sphingobacterium zeae TaxID=1776859 RepID=A0ABU0UC30_9SPHI|nr:hypothetical protein [Sphingobacterium zeae]MDQ1152384.1 putative membrane protein [Sphingobacterium zeae]
MMEINEKFKVLRIAFLNIHLIATILWVGAVYMGAVIDWPAARDSVKKGQFPFRFIIGQGTRVFYSVYTGISLLWISGIGLTILGPPLVGPAKIMLVLKVLLLMTMTGLTMYGTFGTWSKLQLSLDEEATERYEGYIFRAYITLISGLIASILGLNMFN